MSNLNLKFTAIEDVLPIIQRELQLWQLRMPNTPAVIVDNEVTFVVESGKPGNRRHVPYVAPKWGRDKGASFDLMLEYNMTVRLTEQCAIVEGGLGDARVTHKVDVVRESHSVSMTFAKERAVFEAVLEVAIKSQQVMFLESATARARFSLGEV